MRVFCVLGTVSGAPLASAPGEVDNSPTGTWQPTVGGSANAEPDPERTRNLTQMALEGGEAIITHLVTTLALVVLAADRSNARQPTYEDQHDRRGRQAWSMLLLAAVLLVTPIDAQDTICSKEPSICNGPYTGPSLLCAPAAIPIDHQLVSGLQLHWCHLPSHVQDALGLAVGRRAIRGLGGKGGGMLRGNTETCEPCIHYRVMPCGTHLHAVLSAFSAALYVRLLHDKNLAGTIPTQIGLLTSVSWLYASSRCMCHQPSLARIALGWAVGRGWKGLGRGETCEPCMHYRVMPCGPHLHTTCTRPPRVAFTAARYGRELDTNRLSGTIPTQVGLLTSNGNL